MAPARIDVWISSPVRSRKPVLMKTMRSRAARMHSRRFRLVRRSSSITPTLRVLRARPSTSSTRSNSSQVKAVSSAPCHLRLDDIDAAGAAVAVAAEALEVMHGAKARHRRVHDALEYLVAVRVEDGVAGHQMADVAHEQQAAAGQCQRAAVGGGELSIIHQHPMHRLAALLEGLGQRTGPSARASCDRRRSCRRHPPPPPSLRSPGWW